MTDKLTIAELKELKKAFKVLNFKPLKGDLVNIELPVLIYRKLRKLIKSLKEFSFISAIRLCPKFNS